MHGVEQKSKLLVSPLETPVVVPYITSYISLLKKFRLCLGLRLEGLGSVTSFRV